MTKKTTLIRRTLILPKIQKGVRVFTQNTKLMYLALDLVFSKSENQQLNKVASDLYRVRVLIHLLCAA